MIATILWLLAAFSFYSAVVFSTWKPIPSPTSQAKPENGTTPMTTEATTELLEGAEDIVTLVDEDGKNHDFQVVDIIEVEGKEYALLLPAESEDPEQDEVLVLRFLDDAFEMIEDEAEFQAVVAVLEAMNADDADDRLL